MEITIDKTYKYINGGFFTVIAADLDSVSIYRVGGGLVKKVEKELFVENFVRADIPDEFLQGVFSIEDNAPIVGWSNPNQLWNGWAQPAIELKALLRFCNLTEADLVKSDLGYRVKGSDCLDSEFIQCTISGFEDHFYTDGWCWHDDTPEDPKERAELIAKILEEDQ
tara:strand:- start:8318 stop:8818 length:501 start_codon:yes stop_codon:yes gene_type:complete